MVKQSTTTKKRTAATSTPQSVPLPDRTHVLIIGAGFGGLGAAIKLNEAGFTDFVVLDKGNEVGGTWRDNTYPGAACDVPSNLYSYSFALNPNWSRSFSPQPEIQDYLRRTAAESGVMDRMRFNVDVQDAAWDDTDQVWRVETSAGPITADVVVSATGPLSEPRLPDIKGIEGFGGEIFHSARWNHDYDLTDKRVAVIGTGASAIQIVPEVAKIAGRLDVYQRTAAWVLPRWDRPYTTIERLGFRHVPGLQRAYRTAVYWGREGFVPAFTRWPWLAEPARLASLFNLRRGISDPELREELTPQYQIGCKRILISNTYYPALNQDHVDLVTDPIQEVTGTGIRTADGTEREVDVIIVATGFYTTEMPIADHMKGQEGSTLADTWREGGMAAYKGSTVSGFPNLFFLIGPNTGLGHSSMVFMIESQINYVVSALRTMKERGLSSVQPKASAQREWNDDLQRRMEPTVWNTGGCASWYLDEHGRNTTLWPRATFTFRRLLRTFDAAKYHVRLASESRTKENVA